MKWAMISCLVSKDLYEELPRISLIGLISDNAILIVS